MGDKADVWQGTLALMVLKTLAAMGPLHGYGIARRIEQTSGNLLSLNYGTLYPALLKLEQEGAIDSEWGVSENNRKAKFYRLTTRRTEAAREGIEALGAGDGRPGAIPGDGGAVVKQLRACLRRLIGPSRARDDEDVRRRARQPPPTAHRRQPARGHGAPTRRAGARC